MGYFLNVLEKINQDLSSDKATVIQAIGNAQYAVEKIFSRKKRREDKHASRWDALHKYYRFSNDNWGLNIMDLCKDLSRAAADPEPANYFQQLLTLVKDSSEAQESNIEVAFWIYWGKRYHPEWQDPENLYNLYNASEAELRDKFLLALMAVGNEAIEPKAEKSAELEPKPNPIVYRYQGPDFEDPLIKMAMQPLLHEEQQQSVDSSRPLKLKRSQ